MSCVRMERKPLKVLLVSQEVFLSVDLTEVGIEGVDWIHLAKDRDRCRALVNKAMNIRFSQNAGSLLTS
jgi:hypothetical protein